MNKLAIIDVINQDIGLKILFPEADYYIYKYDNNKVNSIKKYNINPIIINNNYENINSDKYDYLFIIISLYDTTLYEPEFCQNITYNTEIKSYFDRILNIINNNNFKKVVLFDNYDFN
jgi:hypothetical protein